MKKRYIKTNRTFTFVRKHGWLITVLVAFGGLWEPKLGLIVLFIMAGLAITAFFNGRFWCGNICPHGSLFDRIMLPKSKNMEIPDFLKSKTMTLGFFLFFMFNFGRKMIKVFSHWGTYDFLDKLGFLFVTTYLMVLVLGGLLAIFITPRTWCQFCPMGTIQKVSYSVGKKLDITKSTDKKVTISDQSLCINCGKCEKVCPFQLSPYTSWDENNKFSDINCIKCSTCVVNCPKKILTIE